MQFVLEQVPAIDFCNHLFYLQQMLLSIILFQLYLNEPSFDVDLKV